MYATYAAGSKSDRSFNRGVLSTEGGYAAHASVVAYAVYGKISLVRPDVENYENVACRWRYD